MTRMAMIAGAVLPVLVGTTLSVGNTVTVRSEAPTSPTLVELVESFFRSDEEKTRQALIGEIEKAAGDSTHAVAEAIKQAQLWRPLPDRRASFPFESGGADTLTVAYQLPAEYDPKRPYPLLVCLPTEGAAPQTTLALAARLLGNAAASFVMICPERMIGGAFHQAMPSDANLPALLRQIRRRIHVDADRTFLFGLGSGGDAVWLAAIAHADLFAGAIALSGYPKVPYARQVYPLLLANLRSLPLLTVWAVADDPQATARQRAVATHNRAIESLARSMKLPISSVELAPTAATVASPLVRDAMLMGHRDTQTQVAAMLARRRPLPPSSVSCWFRYPAQGHTAWLRQTRFMGDVWEAEQLSILPAPTSDRDLFIKEVVAGKLAYLSGRIEDQTITIETRRCARIDLLLPDGLLDLDRPITVRCNGKKRYEGLADRSNRTLLSTAYETWDFQRLSVARLSFSIKADPGRP